MDLRIAHKKEDLPKLKEGYVRVVHLTKHTNLDEMRNKGLHYEKYGMLSSNATWYGREEEVDYHTYDKRFSGPGTKAIIFDVPEKEIRIHNNLVKSPGLLPSKYLVGEIDVSKEKPKKASIEDKVSLIIGMLSLLLSLFIFTEKITGNAVGFGPKNGIHGILLFIVGICGLFIYLSKNKS